MVNEIVMYHCCRDCARSIGIPRGRDCDCFDCGCKDNCKEVNPDGGLTSCRTFIKK